MDVLEVANVEHQAAHMQLAVVARVIECIAEAVYHHFVGNQEDSDGEREGTVVLEWQETWEAGVGTSEVPGEGSGVAGGAREGSKDQRPRRGFERLECRGQGKRQGEGSRGRGDLTGGVGSTNLYLALPKKNFLGSRTNEVRRSNETMSVYRPAQDWGHTNYINCIYARSGALIE